MMETTQVQRYSPLKTNQLNFLTYCPECDVNFSNVTERVLHCLVSSSCKKIVLELHAYENNSNLINSKMDVSGNMNCEKCTENGLFFNPVKYCLHRDAHSFSQMMCCIICTKVVFTVNEFFKHKCIQKFLSEKPKSKSSGKSYTHSVEISWFFCLSDFTWNQVLGIVEGQNLPF